MTYSPAKGIRCRLRFFTIRLIEVERGDQSVMVAEAAGLHTTDGAKPPPAGQRQPPASYGQKATQQEAAWPEADMGSTG